MTQSEAAARLREKANGTISGDDLRAMACDLYGKSRDREVTRLLQDAGYMRIARTESGRTELDPAYLARLRRDFSGPLRLDGVNLVEGPDVTAVEEGRLRWYFAPHGAVMRLNHWLSEQMTPPAG